MNDEPIALEAYEILAEAYASVIDTKPHNAYYERPATLSLLPEVGGMRVLDAACGPGVYAEWLVSRGAEVVVKACARCDFAPISRREGYPEPGTGRTCLRMATYGA